MTVDEYVSSFGVDDRHQGSPQAYAVVVLLIGSGKLARHLEHWFSIHAEYSAALLTWNRHQDPMLLYQYLSTATQRLLAIADAAIIDFYEQYLLQYPGSVVHFSGAIHDDRINFVLIH